MHRSQLFTVMSCAALLSGNAVTQAREINLAKVLQVQDVVAALEARGSDVPGEVTPLARFVRLAESHFQHEAQAAPPANPPLQRTRRPTIRVVEPQNVMLVSGERDKVELVEAMLRELRRDVTRELRLQCTLVRLPKDVARNHGLVAGRAMPVDEVAAGNVQKDAVQAKGSLQNLPEVKVVPFVPFRLGAPTADQDGRAERAPLRLRGEAVLVNDDEALFAVQLVAGDLPADQTVLPQSPLLDRTFRPKAGSGVMLLSPAGAGAAGEPDALVLWLRFVEVAQAPPK
jgi:hypothetical protein